MLNIYYILLTKARYITAVFTVHGHMLRLLTSCRPAVVLASGTTTLSEHSAASCPTSR